MEQILDGMTMDVEQTEKDKLKSVFPECFVEGKLDIDKLLNLCGEYIDDDFEKYEFKWKGKTESLQLAGKRSMGTLRPAPEESVNFDTTENLYIEGDNLEVLKLLQTSYYRKVKMIYIDPPYNTGNDFVYEDDFADTLARYKEVTSQTTKSNPESMGRFHTNWLNMMYPRLRLAANLLRDDGVIFISIDDNEVHNLRKLCDEVFGEENFVAMFSWRTDGNFDNQAKVKKCHEYILLYAKQIVDFPPPPVIDPSVKTDSKLFKDTIRNTIIKNGSKNPIMTVEIPVGFPCDIEKGVIEKTKVKYPQYSSDIRIENFTTQNTVIASTGWSSREQLISFIENRFEPVLDTKGQATTFVLTKTGAIETIKERTENQSHVISSLRNFGGTQKASALLGEMGISFSFPKPMELIKYFVQMNEDKDFIVLDFFSGSATTAHAVMQLNAEDGGNRKYIMVQLPEVTDEKSEAHKAGYKNICEIGKERIRRAGKKLLEDDSQLKLEEAKPLDIGFKVFKLDTSNLKTWDSSPLTDETLYQLSDRLNSMTERVKPDRTDLDMAYEVMLKLGVPLTETVSAVEIDGKRAYCVGEDCLLLICLEANLSTENVEQMAEYAPAQMIFEQSCFADITALSNAKLVLRDRGIVMKFV